MAETGSDLLVDRLPHVLAVAVAEFRREGHPYVKLHRLTNAVEVFTRFATVVLLSDLLDHGGAAGFPNAVRQRLADRLERPTFGAWAELLQTALKALTDARRPCIVGELPAFVQRQLLPLLERVIPLRNTLAHSGRLTPAAEGEYLATYPPLFEVLVSEAEFLGRLQVVGRPADGDAFVLRGEVRPDVPFPRFDLKTLPANVDPPGAGRVLLIAEGRAVNLFPLHVYGDVFHYQDKGPERTRAVGAGSAGDPRALFEHIPEASPSAQLYFRRGQKDYLEYTAFSPAAAHSQEGFVALERFKAIFRLEEWRHVEDAKASRKAFNFLPWCRELLELFVGRSEQVRQVARWAGEQHAGAVCWVHGHPGVGKSAFMAALAMQFFTDERRFCRIAHFFRSGDPRCNRSKFLENALVSLWSVAGRTEAMEADPKRRTEQFARVLRDVATAEAAQPGNQWRRIVFLLDGLDEAAQVDRAIVDLVLSNQLPGVVWLCAGREEFGVGEAFRGRGAYLPFGPEGLPALTDGDVREILDRECGRQIYELIARDRPGAAPGGNDNPFLTELVRRSAGLPLYLRLLVQDIRESRISFREGEEKRLPQGLASYYERILERLQVSDVSAVLTPVFCLLAVAKAPLTFETIKLLMASDRLLRRAGGTDLLRRALEFGHLMLKRVQVSEDPKPRPVDGATPPAIVVDTGYTLYHESFREHLLGSNTVAQSVGAAQDDLCDFAVQWKSLAANLFPFRYVLRFGSAHLLEASRFDDLERLLRTLPFLEARADAGLVFELADELIRMPWERLRLVGEAIRREIHLLDRQPATLFQCLWNQCWWYDCREAAQHYEPPEGGWSAAGPPWDRPGPKLCELLEEWRAQKERDEPGLVWARSLRPPAAVLGCATHAVLTGHEGPVTAVAISPDGRRLASTGEDGTLRLWDIGSGRQLARVQHRGPLTCVAFSPDGQRLATGSHPLLQAGEHDAPETVRICDATDGQPLLDLLKSDHDVVREELMHLALQFYEHRFQYAERPPRGAFRTATCLAFSPDGKRLATGGKFSALWIWDVATGKLLGTRGDVQYQVHAAAFSPDGRYLVSSGSSTTLIHLWPADGDGEPVLLDQETGRQAASAPPVAANTRRAGGGGPVTCLAVSPDSRWIAAGSQEKVCIWDVERRDVVATLTPKVAHVSAVTFSPDGARVVFAESAKADRVMSVRIWDWPSGQVTALPGHEGSVTGVAFTGDGYSVVSSSIDATVRVWHAGTIDPSPVRPESGAETVRFSPDGRRLAFGDAVFDVETGLIQAPTTREPGIPVARPVDFTADGQWLAVGVDDDSVEIRMAATGEHLAMLRPRQVRVVPPDGPGDPTLLGCPYREVSFDAQGLRLAAVDYDDAVRVWDVLSGSQIAWEPNPEPDHRWPVRYEQDGRLTVTLPAWRVVRVAARGRTYDVQILRGEPWSIVRPADDPVTAVKDGLATLISVCGEPTTWLPAPFDAVAIRSDGLVLAGVLGRRLEMYHLHGVPAPETLAGVSADEVSEVFAAAAKAIEGQPLPPPTDGAAGDIYICPRCGFKMDQRILGDLQFSIMSDRIRATTRQSWMTCRCKRDLLFHWPTRVRVHGLPVETVPVPPPAEPPLAARMGVPNFGDPFGWPMGMTGLGMVPGHGMGVVPLPDDFLDTLDRPSSPAVQPPTVLIPPPVAPPAPLPVAAPLPALDKAPLHPDFGLSLQDARAVFDAKEMETLHWLLTSPYASADRVINARGVCLYRLGEVKAALATFASVSVAGSALTWTGPVTYRRNFAAALLANGEVDVCEQLLGLMEAAHEDGGCTQPYRQWIERYRKGMAVAASDGLPPLELS